jgi:hypothetical protein
VIAALPMYDRPENRAAHDALWALIRDALRIRGLAAPEALDRALPYDAGWGRPDLVLGQICNLPWRARFRGSVTRIAAADYGLPDTPPGHYHSVMVARRGEPLPPRPRLALNDPLSCSGWDAPQEWLAREGVRIGGALVTGAHAASVRAVAEGRADLAGIDAVTWGMLTRWEPAAAGLAVIGRTLATPGMTFIAAGRVDPLPRRAALEEAVAALPTEHRETLGLRAVVALPDAAYDRPLPPPPEAVVARAG